MLATMASNLQKQNEHVDAYTMIPVLRGMFENQARAERYNISKALFACNLVEGSPVSPHIIKIMGYIETLDKLGCELKDDLATDVILQSLSVSYGSFIINFHMNGMEKIMAELHGMLKTVEDSIKKNPKHVMIVRKEKKKRSVGRLPRAMAKNRFSISPRALCLRQKASLALLLMRNASTTIRKDIGSGTIRSTWRSRRRREVRLPL
jgi:hypothetical protein